MNIFKANDSIIFEANLQEQIVGTLKKLYKGKNVSLSDHILFIGITDTNEYNSLINSDFASDFQEFVSNDCGYDLRKVEIVDYIKNGWTRIDDDVFIYIFDSNQTDPIVNNVYAEISIYKNTGSLLEKVYRLPSNENGKYFIGRGDEKRENDIIIENSPTSEFWEFNKYVRSAHAHITYQKKEGFLLWADRDGTAAFGSRTRIYRKGEQTPIDVTNENVPQLLCDGDKIELGKHVVLLFIIVESK